MICNKCQRTYVAPKPIFNKEKDRFEQDPKRNRWLCSECNQKEQEKKSK